MAPRQCASATPRPVNFSYVYGELMDAIYHALKDALAPIESAWAQQQTLIEHLEQI